MMLLFQAEDGIRALVRSRGLGDVYKRQVVDERAERRERLGDLERALVADEHVQHARGGGGAVSCTHLTLPTSDLV